MRVAIIGAGITGLTAGFRLKKKGIDFTLFEASRHAGGVIRSEKEHFYLAENGPNTILETSSVIKELILDLELEHDRVYASSKAKNRYIIKNRRLVPLPLSPVSFFTSSLFSFKTKLAIIKEPFVRTWDNSFEESLAHFTKRRLSQEFLDYAINPFTAGVYAGDPEKLSARYAFPKLYEIEQKYGSLILGQVLGAQERKKRDEISKSKARMFSFKNGIQTLTDALADKIKDSIVTDSPVKKIIETEEGWKLEFAAERSAKQVFDAVLFAGTAYDLPKIDSLRALNTDLETFENVYYPPVASIIMGFRKEDVAHPLDGFGMLVPKVENLRILGTLFSSSLFSHRAPNGHVLLTTYLGGARNPELAMEDADMLIEKTRMDLKLLLGITAKPTFLRCFRHERAIPQYNVGYGRVLSAIDDIEKKNPGLFMAGHFKDGISVGDSMVSGHNAADKIEDYLLSNKKPEIRTSESDEAALLINLGSPVSPSRPDVKAFLREFLMDKRIIDFPWILRWPLVNLLIAPLRAEKSSEAYAKIWTREGSPLTVINKELRDKLGKELDIPIELAMRYGTPTMENMIKKLLAGNPGLKEVLLVPLYPHYAMSSFETGVIRAKEIFKRLAPKIKLKTIEPFYEDQDYIEALWESSRSFLAKEYHHVLFSFHGLPERHVRKADPTGSHCLKNSKCCQRPPGATLKSCYRVQAIRTMEAFVKRANIRPEECSISFQSRMGRGSWLKPYTYSELQRLPKFGVKKLLVISPSFTADSLETLYEIAILGKQVFRAAGGKKLDLIPCLNTHPAWIKALKKIIDEAR
ncbi:protoporphyrinogen oxidase [Elusimicrobiota bacterium]